MSKATVIVVGGGIGGLAAALALRQVGYAATVLEQASVLTEVGAGVQLAPNASRILIDLGLRSSLSRYAVEPLEQIRRRWQDGRVIGSMPLSASMVRQSDAPYWQLHRADLHRALLEACESEGGIGQPVSVISDCEVADVENTAAGPVAVTKDGRRFGADALIGADGIRSAVRRSCGFADTLQRSDQLTYRALVPSKDLADDPITRWLLDRPQNTIWLGPGAHVVHFLVRRSSALSIVVQKRGSDRRIAEGQTTVVELDELVDSVPGWDERLRHVLCKAEGTILLQPLFHRRPDPEWVQGRIALLGDAAHAMLPYQGQGASQAIEDAAVLAEELSLAGPKMLEEALVRYQGRRSRRVSQVQIASAENERLYHLADGEAQERRDAVFGDFAGEAHRSFSWLWRGPKLHLAEPESYDYPFGTKLDTADDEYAHDPSIDTLPV
ncbi:MAG: FAD-dependent monooxygenase [Mycobacterium sp.]